MIDISAVHESLYAAFRCLGEWLLAQLVIGDEGICGNLCVQRRDILFHQMLQCLGRYSVIRQLVGVGDNERDKLVGFRLRIRCKR